ncbi:transcription initiation factor IIB family protein [Candidatus Woesearchaeota archaeon]|nr:transcription initiation factor IIB family protein [Candidatus Woesearchaeota archaeon]
MKEQTCSSCGSGNLLESGKAELFCRDCGIVEEDQIVAVGIEGTDFREGGSFLSGTMPMDGKVVKASWLASYRERSNLQAKRAISFVTDKLSLPQYVEQQAYWLFKTASFKGMARGRSIERIALACLYAVCARNELPVSPQELVQYSTFEKKELMRSLKLVKRELNLKMVIQNPMDFLPKYISRLGLRAECYTLASLILEKAQSSTEFVGKSPRCLLGASLYLAAKQCGERITQRDIALRLGISDVAIRRRTKDMRKIL